VRSRYKKNIEELKDIDRDFYLNDSPNNFKTLRGALTTLLCTWIHLKVSEHFDLL